MRYILELEIEADRLLSEEELAEGRELLVTDLGGDRGRVVDMRIRLADPPE